MNRRKLNRRKFFATLLGVACTGQAKQLIAAAREESNLLAFFRARRHDVAYVKLIGRGGIKL